MWVFDNVSFIIIGLVIVCIVSLFCGNQEIVLMVVSGLLGFLAKDKLVSNESVKPVDGSPVKEEVDEVDVDVDG